MYRIKFPSGEVATIESPEALTEAVRSGSVTSYCFILHERSGQWLPIVRHPHYHQALTARGASTSAAPADVRPILAEPLAAPEAAPAATGTGPAADAPPNPAAAERSTQAALEVPNLDELLEMPSLPPDARAPEPPAAPQPARGPRSRSRELEFLYVPEAKSAGQPRSAPRTAGPPPRPGSVKPPEPKAEAAPTAPVASAPAAATPPASVATAPTAPRPAPSPAMAPTVMRPAPPPAPAEPAAAAPEPVSAPAAPEPADAAVATLAPPMRRAATRYDDGLVDPVEAALNFDAPPPIELSDPPREWAPSGSRRLFMAAGFLVALGAGMLVWSPWSGTPSEIAAAAAPARPSDPSADEIPADATFDMDTPAEEEPAFGVFAQQIDQPTAARTSFGGTAAQSGAAVSALPNPDPAVLPGAPRELRVAVPVVNTAENLDSVRLARLKQAITE